MNRAALNRATLAGLALACLGAAGCHEPVTEVVVVMTSDLSIPGETDTITLLSGPGINPPSNFGVGLQNSLSTFPLSMGFVSENGGTGVFSIIVQLTRLSSNFQQQIVISRTVTGIRFVPHETRMLVLSLPRVCACSGTTCPNPGINPDCDNLADPITEPFDPALAPPSGGIQPGQPGGPVTPPPRDAGRVIVDPGMSSDGGSGPLDGPRPDGGLTDGGSTDGSMTDGARTDAGASDGGTTDGARTDGGAIDGGAADGGATDGGATDGAGPADAGIG